MTAESNSEIDNNELICPITLEIFRDPVLAKDGYVYEREAITEWILERGTSPITREILKIKDLQPHDRLRDLAAQRRTSMDSCIVPLDRIFLPASQVTPSIITELMQPGQVTSLTNKQRSRVFLRRFYNIVGTVILIALTVVPSTVAYVLYRKVMQKEEALHASTYKRADLPDKPIEIYSESWRSSLTTRSKIFYPRKANESYYYKAIGVTTSHSNTYTFKTRSEILICGYLYNDSFIPQELSKNLLISDTNVTKIRQFQISYYLNVSQKYTLVLTTRYKSTTGTFTIFVNSPTLPADISIRIPTLK